MQFFYIIISIFLFASFGYGKKIALMGGTGGVGKEFVEIALTRGHRVRLLARKPSKVKHKSAYLEIIKGDATSTDDVKNLVKGTDVLVSTVGSKKGELVMEKTANNIIAAKPKRSIVLSSLGLGGTARILKPLFLFVSSKRSIDDYENADRILSDSVKPVAIVRPTGLSNRRGKLSYLATEQKGIRKFNRISRADVAMFLADLVDDTSWDGKGVQLY